MATIKTRPLVIGVVICVGVIVSVGVTVGVEVAVSVGIIVDVGVYVGALIIGLLTKSGIRHQATEVSTRGTECETGQRNELIWGLR